MRSHKTGLLALVVVMAGGVWLAQAGAPSAAETAKNKYLANVQTGNPGLKSIGNLNFGPEGILLVADPQAAAIVAISTGDTGPVVKLKKRVDNVRELAASALGAAPDAIEIKDMTVNPASGKIYLAVVRSADKQAAILTIDADGKVRDLPLDQAKYVSVSLPGEDRAKVRNITDLEFASDRVLVAGQSNEEFSSKIYSIALPLTHNAPGKMFSTETYHVAHGKWETKAPIQSFIPYEEAGKSYVVGSFACTPIAKFPLDDMKAGGQVRGTSVVELGSGNRPLDMFTYTKDGQKWLVTHTYRMHFKKNTYGPSKWWGVRVKMNYLDALDINEKAALRDESKPKGPDGIEIVDALAGAVQVAQLNNDEIVVLRADPKTDTEDKLSLEIAQLP
jgi:hypothetical protein